MKLKKEHGALQIKGLGIYITQNSSEAEIKEALKHAPHLASYFEGVPKSNKDVKSN